MNIIELLKNKKSSVILRYYGENDMAGGFQIQTLVNEFKEICNYYKSKDFKINSIDEYVDYIVIETNSNLKELIPIVRDDLKIEVANMVDKIIEIKEKYKIRDVNTFIKSKYEIL